ncbi:outer membrane assembly protein BamC [Pseudoalteromonas citrea]|uniref:Outer membrane assembly protein BamC n=1 Tax=Pseudoalteromonas citrea TaxID=43655 RepID=A0A5S3XW83_9GAMM|nr:MULTISPECIES: outer membrane protein assembly factor BamC [Pseudoalteromonas]RJE75867.1 outer membrane assembly protein BamC [Pseudoalteromonas sp. MSK9-3]TMP43366.1 outer membrane assembly protein BamC [Pseudoalteromonas citrea]TMP62235.1 outer membrane assembly protein BamC [Pseudoalteromonas citrea]
MQYWIPKALTVGVILGLSGCSVFVNDAHNERNYRVNDAVKTPAQLEQPYQDPTFQMDVATFNNDPEAKSFRPPQQVLTLAAGSWVEENETIARVYFDKNDGIDDLNQFIWRAVDSVMANHNTDISLDEREKGSVSTNWYSLIKPIEGWFWEDNQTVSEQQVKFVIEQKEHQRTASLKAELIDYRSDKQPLNPLLQQQLEVRALNEVVAEFDYLYRLLQVEMRKEQGVLSLDMGFDDKGYSAFVTEQDHEIVIDRFASFLERVNFTIIKIDRESGLISVRYEKPDDSVWDSIWGDDALLLPLNSGDYTINVAKTKEAATSLTWRNAAGDVLEPEVMTQLQQALLVVLRDKGLTI